MIDMSKLNQYIKENTTLGSLVCLLLLPQNTMVKSRLERKGFFSNLQFIGHHGQKLG